MYRRFASRVAWGAALVAALSVSACAKTKSGGGLEILLATNLATPGDFDTLHISIGQQTRAGGDGGSWNSLFDSDFLVPGETTLPTSFSIAAGTSPDQVALIQVTASKNGRPVDLREAQVQVPTDRVAQLTLILAESCLGQVTTLGNVAVPTCPTGQSCQPATGTCGPTIIPGPLPTYTSSALDHIDASVGAFASHGNADGGTDAGHDATLGPNGVGCNPATGLCTITDDSQLEPRGIAVDSAHVFWTHYSSNGCVMRADLNGAAVVTLLPGRDNPAFIASDGTSIYWTEGQAQFGALMKASIDGGNVTELAAGWDETGGLVVRGSTVYWTEGSDAGLIMRIAADGGVPSTVATAVNPQGLAVVDSGVYWTSLGGGSGTPTPYIGKAPLLGGGVASTLVTLSGFSSPAGIAVSATTVYWGDLSNQAVMQCSLDGAAPQVFQGGVAPAGIAVDSMGLYWTEQTAGHVVQIGDSGTQTFQDPDGGQPTALAAGATRLYWVNYRQGTIQSIPKL